MKLNLPETDFPMRANLAQREPEVLARWEKMSLYETARKNNAGNTPFILHDGPPYANGAIHIGHVVNKVLKDIILKSQRMEGFNAPYVPGWDCHGLPIELEVEKKHGKAGDKISKAEFCKRCREYAQKQVEAQRADFIRLGVLGDWDAPYLTMAHKTEADTVRALLTMLKDGYISRGVRPVYWCLDCNSALAEAEVEYRDQSSDTVDVLFRATDTAALAKAFGASAKDVGEGDVGFPIWTTTPWTLAANQALAVGEELSYQLLHMRLAGRDYRLVVAEELREAVLERYDAKLVKTLGACAGAKLVDLRGVHPMYKYEVPVVLGHHVTTNTGTGIVHIAPGHGEDDFLIGERYQLPLESMVRSNGCYAPNLETLGGMHVRKALDPITALLKDNDSLLVQSKYEHSYPCCWRHKSGIIFRTTQQWFVRMQHQKLLDKACACVEKEVEFEPPRARARMTSMLDERPDWCISRQRTWGIPIAVFTHKETGELHPDTEALMLKVAEEIEQHGIECWHERDTKDWLGADAEDYERCADVMDVWFDSGVTHRVVLDSHEQLQRPADIYLEGSDQHRGWFQSSLFTSVAMNQSAPYKTLISHGFVVDDAGYKMSKSRGNIVAPQEVINKMGADILRLWVASTDYRDEMSISDEALSRMSDMYRRMRNTMRFMLSNLYDFDAAKHSVEQDKLPALDRWILHKAALLEQEVRQDYRQYQFHLCCQKIHNFCAIELGSFYLDVIKDRQYTLHADGHARRSSQTAMHGLLTNMVRWLAPILSFTADELWPYLPDKQGDSVFLSAYTDNLSEFVKEDKSIGDADWDLLIEARDAANVLIEQARGNNEVGSSLEAELSFYCDARLHELMTMLGEELRFVMLSSEAEVLPFSEGKSVEESKMAGLKVALQPSKHRKCARCWHRRSDVPEGEEAVCARCEMNMQSDAAKSEQRRFA